jgi:hypothetical protein
VNGSAGDRTELGDGIQHVLATVQDQEQLLPGQVFGIGGREP